MTINPKHEVYKRLFQTARTTYQDGNGEELSLSEKNLIRTVINSISENKRNEAISAYKKLENYEQEATPQYLNRQGPYYEKLLQFMDLIRITGKQTDGPTRELVEHLIDSYGSVYGILKKKNLTTSSVNQEDLKDNDILTDYGIERYLEQKKELESAKKIPNLPEFILNTYWETSKQATPKRFPELRNGTNVTDRILLGFGATKTYLLDKNTINTFPAFISNVTKEPIPDVINKLEHLLGENGTLRKNDSIVAEELQDIIEGYHIVEPSKEIIRLKKFIPTIEQVLEDNMIERDEIGILKNVFAMCAGIRNPKALSLLCSPNKKDKAGENTRRIRREYEERQKRQERRVKTAPDEQTKIIRESAIWTCEEQIKLHSKEEYHLANIIKYLKEI